MNNTLSYIALGYFLAGIYISLPLMGKEKLLKLHFANKDQVNYSIGKGKLFQENLRPIYTGGGSKEKIIISLKRKFPVNAGSVSFFYKLNLPCHNKRIMLFDVLGTPEWWDRFNFTVKPLNNKKTCLRFSCSETNRQRYAGRAIEFITEIDNKKWQHIAFSWKNINSGKPDAELKLYLNGVLVKERKKFELSIKDNAKNIILCGGNPPIKPGPSNCASITKVNIWGKVLSPAAIMQLSGRNINVKYPLKAFVSIPRLTGKVPIIDGRLQPEEWDSCQSLGPFCDLQGKGVLADWQTKINITYDDHNIYVAWKAFGNGRPKGEKLKRDGNLWYHDSLELSFSPDSKTVFHFIGNAYNSIYDEISMDAGKSFNPGWNAAWQYKSSIKKNCWTGELAINYKILGIKPPEFGQKWFFNACRNNFRPDAQTMWNHAKSFKTLDSLGTIEFSEKQVIVNKIDLGKVFAGNNTINFSLNNPWKLHSVLSTQIQVGEPPNIKTSSMNISQNRLNGKISFEYSANPKGINKFILQIRNSKTNKILLSYPAYVKVNLPLQVNIISNFYKGFITAKIDATRIKNGFSYGELKLTNLKNKIEYCKKFSSPKINLKIMTQEMSSGKYKLSVVLNDSFGKPIVTREKEITFFEKPHYISKNAGKKNYTKPWKELLNLQKQVISCWNRKYSYNNTLFPISMVSNGGELLTKAPFFKYNINGISYSLKAAHFKVIKSTPEKIIVKVSAVDDNLCIKGKIIFEYDGIIIYKLNIVSNTKLPLKLLQLQIPLNPNSANYVFVGHELQWSNKRNVIGKTPGEIKKYSFYPMIGVGNMKRALYWFCESDEGWRPYDRNDTITIKRNARNVMLSFNIIKNFSIERSLKLSFGFICSPFKPMKHNIDDLKVFHFWPGGPFYSTKNYDYGKFNLKKAAKLGTKVVALHEWWPKYYGGFAPCDSKSFKKFVDHAHQLGMRVIVYRSAMENMESPSLSYFKNYWLTYPVAGWSKYNDVVRNNMSGVVRCPNAPEYIDWYVGSCQELVRKYGIDGFYYDFGVYPCTNQLHNCGYLPKNKKHAYSTKKGDQTGTIGVNILSNNSKYSERRPTWPVLKHRELWKRMYNMIKENKGDKGIITAHASAPGNAVYTPFIDSVVHSEHAACYMRPDQLPSLEQYRLFFSRAHTGLPGEVIALKQHKNTEALLSISLLHGEWSRPTTYGHNVYFKKDDYEKTTEAWEIFSKFDIDNAKWVPYWSHQDNISSGPRNKVYTSYWYKPGKLLMVVSNISNSPQIAQITLKNRLFEYTTAIDSLTGKNITIPTNKTIALKIKPHSYRFIYITK